jgi:hypothetical protein
MLTFDIYEKGEAEPLARVNVVSTTDPVIAKGNAVALIEEHVGPGDYKAVQVTAVEKPSSKGVDMTAQVMVSS